MDIDGIPYGVDFRDHIQAILQSADLLLAIIGPKWAGEMDDGHLRIMEPSDPVRVEIETAVRQKLPIIPVLVDGAVAITESQLPAELKAVAYLNAATVATGRDFHGHMDRVIAAIDQIAPGAPEAAPVRGPGVAAAPAQAGVTIQLNRDQLLRLGPLVAVLILPFAAALAIMAPPWPGGSAPITALLVGAAVALSYQLLERLGPVARRWLTGLAIALTVVAAAGYLAGVSLYTYETPKHDRLFARGTECSADAKAVFAAKCPALGPDELASAQYEAGYLWTTRSIGLVEAGLAGLWFTAFLGMSALVAAFLPPRRRA